MVVRQDFMERKLMDKQAQPLTGVWQNGGNSAKLSISNSINIGGLLNICASKSPTSPSPKTLPTILKDKGKFKNLTQQNINYIFAALWKKHTNDYPIKRGL